MAMVRLEVRAQIESIISLDVQQYTLRQDRVLLAIPNWGSLGSPHSKLGVRPKSEPPARPSTLTTSIEVVNMAKPWVVACGVVAGAGRKGKVKGTTDHEWTG